MYKVALLEDKTVLEVFNTDVYLDDSKETFTITDDEFKLINDSKRFDFWQYKEGKLVESEFKVDIVKKEFNKNQERQRAIAYQKESDPLFMKYQRDTSTKEEWLAKVEEIKARYPYQE